MHPSKMGPWQFGNTKWGKKVTVPNSSCCLFFPFATESSKKHGCRCENGDSLIFHHLVEQLMQEVFTGSTCSNSPTCCNAGTPCRIWPTTLLQVKSPLCCVLVKEVIMLLHKYLPIVFPTAVHKQFSLQRMSRLLELGILFIIAERAVMEVLQHFHVRILCFLSYFWVRKSSPIWARFSQGGPDGWSVAPCVQTHILAKLASAGQRLQLHHHLLFFFCRTCLPSAHKVDSFQIRSSYSALSFFLFGLKFPFRAHWQGIF